MRKIILGASIGFCLSGLFAFTIMNYESKKSTSEVDQIQGFYIFAKSKPVKDFEYLGTVKGPMIGNHEFDSLVELMIKNAKKEFPEANALVFDGAIKQTHNTKCSAVRIKD